MKELHYKTLVEDGALGTLQESFSGAPRGGAELQAQADASAAGITVSGRLTTPLHADGN